ncbi:hypothetical protein PENTCL1PPCAC_3324, partial [Pristionchus entomophagus]
PMFAVLVKEPHSIHSENGHVNNLACAAHEYSSPNEYLHTGDTISPHGHHTNDHNHKKVLPDATPRNQKGEGVE